MSFAKTIVVGNLGKDPELRFLQSGKPVATFTICANERRGSGENREEKQQWFTANVYGNSAKAVAEHLQKGDQVYVEGRLDVQIWEGRDGMRHTSYINTSDVQFLGKRKRENQSGEAPAATPEAEASSPDLSDDDIPF